MSHTAWGWVRWAAVGLVAGLLLGFAIGWWWWPVEYTNTAPDALRQDYHDDYIVMTATAFELDADQERARERLELLDPEEPARPVVELAERLVEAGADSSDVARLARLAAALGTVSSALAPYLEPPP